MKQEKHAWGSVPHDPHTRHVGSGQLRNTIKPVRRKGFKLTASRRFKHEAFSFPRCARKSPHEPHPQFGAMLPWPIITLPWRNGFQTTKGCRNLALPAADCALSSFLKAEAAPAESFCVAREGIFAAAEVPCETAPFASFSGRTEKDGPARPERGPISPSLVKTIKSRQA